MSAVLSIPNASRVTFELVGTALGTLLFETLDERTDLPR